MIPSFLGANLSECYPTFLAHSDHKALVLTLTPRLYSPKNKRSFCPTDFLDDIDFTDSLRGKLACIEGDSLDWWQRAQTLIKKSSVSYQRDTTGGGHTEVGAYVISSTASRVCPEAWQFLRERGLSPTSQAHAYSILCSLADKEWSDRSGLKVLGLVKEALLDPSERCPGSRKKEIWRLVKQLQVRRKLQRIRDTQGNILSDPASIAREVTDFWAGIMNTGGGDEPACSTYLSKFFGGRDMSILFKALFKPLSLDLVNKALDALQPNSSPGIDGFTIKIYKAFRTEFSPRIMEAMQLFLSTGTIPQDWSLALLNPIPKVAGTPHPKDLRPLVLQNTCLKWITSILSLQLSDIISQITPPQQKGFIKGRFMYDHLYDAFGSWHDMSEGCFLFIDFAKAYDSVTHQFAASFFKALCFPPELVTLLLNLFKSPMALIINGGVCLDTLIWPTSGIRQGCPLSPILFAMLVSPIISRINSVSASIKVLLYADDLLVIIRDPPHVCVQHLTALGDVFREFEFIVGLALNRDKSAVLLKGEWPEIQKASAAACGFPIHHKYKYLGVLLGDIPPTEAFAPAIAKAMGRASAMVHWSLDLELRQQLLELWIMPLLVAPARVVQPSQEVISAVTTIYHTALRTNSWGLTHRILAQPEELGGIGLVPPKTFLFWQHASAFVRMLDGPTQRDHVTVKAYDSWASQLGVVVSRTSLPFFQLSKVPLSGTPFLGLSARSFSKARRGAEFTLPPTTPTHFPLWHNIAFCPPHKTTYHSPQLIREGVLLLSDISDHETFIQRLPMVTKSCYRAGLKRLTQAPRGALTLYHVPSFWCDWGKKRLAQYLSTSVSAEPRQQPSVWSAFSKIRGPRLFKDFVRAALWGKLPVGSRLNTWLNDGGYCPFHCVAETIPHALAECLFLPVAKSFVQLVFPDVSVCVLSRAEESLSHPAGLLIWTAIHSHWRLRCAIKNDPPPRSPPALGRFLHSWCSSLSDWPEASGYSLRTPLIRGFQRGLHDFSTKGTFTFAPTEALQSPVRRRHQASAFSGLKPNWRFLLHEAQAKIASLASQGWKIVFSDGSAVLEDDLGWVGGFGAYFGSSDDFSEPLPLTDPQTNNRAELWALLRVLQIISSKPGGDRWALALDSIYVVNGANGGANAWRERDWVGVAGSLVAHVDLWVQVLELLSVVGARVTVFHVHSHIQLAGNDNADALANRGRLSSGHYSRGIIEVREKKRPQPDPPDVAEIEVVLSSDEELDARFQDLSRRTSHLPMAPRAGPPRQARANTPPPSRSLDFSRSSTPEPDSPQDFGSQDSF